MAEIKAIYGIDAATQNEWDRLGIKSVTALCAPSEIPKEPLPDRRHSNRADLNLARRMGDPNVKFAADRRLGNRRTSDVAPSLPACQPYC